ncbi:hypothetical protein DFH29DRAFT_192074 [Suillus ampliporus]|nr:hypothetical protein DFH29DRAFT_192074 [Suillus ampliporus]
MCHSLICIYYVQAQPVTQIHPVHLLLPVILVFLTFCLQTHSCSQVTHYSTFDLMCLLRVLVCMGCKVYIF